MSCAKKNFIGTPSQRSTYSRRPTREIDIGGVPLGGKNPIRIQSMTTVDTMDTQGSVAQSIRMIKAGCEYVRITAPSIKEAKNLALIKEELHRRGYAVPLVADIHFTPNAAEWAARVVEKVRINPGNYADKKRFQQIEYTDEAYLGELDRIRDRFLPLIAICKEYGTAMRIGTNHGSLSDRIMSRYGDTPLGMVESALEFVRICEAERYRDIVLSMKASNPQIMIRAYRLLAQKLDEESLPSYPFHLGVTEAGDGEEGRIKSAVGIGTLLDEGLGDTIRVSLTEEPEDELPTARLLVERYAQRQQLQKITRLPENTPFPPPCHDYVRRSGRKIADFGASNVPRVMADFSARENISRASLAGVGYRYNEALDKWHVGDTACDYIYVGHAVVDFSPPDMLAMVYPYDRWKMANDAARRATYPLMDVSTYLREKAISEKLNLITVCLDDLSDAFIRKIDLDSRVVLCVSARTDLALMELRAFFDKLTTADCSVPVLLCGAYPGLSQERTQLYASIDLGGLFIDGLGNGLSLTADQSSEHALNGLAFNILQAARMRISKTEYISCPSCGRTLFDLQETTAHIKEKTHHLKGVKIGIMGCIVNGPGEMADADYGYVGSGKGKITLYRGKTVVKRQVPAHRAVEELIELIREDGNWVEMPDKA